MMRTLIGALVVAISAFLIFYTQRQYRKDRINDRNGWLKDIVAREQTLNHLAPATKPMDLIAEQFRLVERRLTYVSDRKTSERILLGEKVALHLDAVHRALFMDEVLKLGATLGFSAKLTSEPSDAGYQLVLHIHWN